MATIHAGPKSRRLAPVLTAQLAPHRFAGPMYRLRMALGQMAGGDVPQSIRFRSRDFWQDVAVDFNTVVERYESLVEENEQLKAELSRQKAEV